MEKFAEIFQADGKKVMVVDDLGSARKILTRLLAQLGISAVAEAPDGAAALETVKAGGVSLVISDWHMPKMTGIELLKEVRGNPSLKELPFILITSASQKEAVIEAANAGVSDFIVKPFNVDTLSNKLNAVLQKVAR